MKGNNKTPEKVIKCDTPCHKLAGQHNSCCIELCGSPEKVSSVILHTAVDMNLLLVLIQSNYVTF